MNKYETMRKERRAEIVNAAKSLICRRGFGEASIKELSEIIGVSRNTLYKYYANMDILAYDIVQSVMERLKEKFILTALPEGNSAQVLRHIINGFFDYAEENTEDILYISLFDAYCSLRSEGEDDLYKEYKRGLTSAKHLSLDMLFVSGQQDGSIRKDICIEEFLAIVSNTVMGLSQRFALLNNKEAMTKAADRRAAREFLVNAIMSYIK